MKNYINSLFGLFLLMNFVLISCSASREQEVEGDLNEFRSWVNTQTANIADRTEEDWQRTKDDFKYRTQELDEKQEKFSDDAKEEYKQLKQRFNEADEERARTREQRTALENWKKELLGAYADTSTITAANVREVYILFMENVRSKHKNWSSQDWDMADMVFDELGKRKEQVDDELPGDDEVKIKALQMEYRTLETAGDVED
ncbi:DUF6565 domain-containing protein [Pontibacter ruber]|uniref:DUF6565 domain-containing protein n=1 Tax=Pontibacter ruber TaxID=1343895 RepID=A0ABW5D237_9BACT|nr:DUF6565 domain-containing protein [Pontibacter ruber]